MNIANISTWRKFCNCHFIFEYVSDFIIKQGIKYISCFIIFVDLINMGITEGKMIGSTLKLLLSLVIDEKVENTRGALLDKAKEIVRNI